MMTVDQACGLAHEPAPPARIPMVSDETVRGLVDEVDRRGVAVLAGFVPPDELASLQAFVRDAVAAAGGQYVVFHGKEGVAGTYLEDLAESREFNSLIRRIYEAAVHRPAPQQSIHQVLRCLSGETGLRECLIFHYDSYVVTVLLPILIPNRGRRGHLILARRRRGVRPIYPLNLLDKAVLDNPLTQLALRRLHARGVLKMTRVEMRPGDLYVFRGYQTLHTNEACDPQHIRSTALFHYGDPHGGSRLRRRMGRVAV